MKELLYTKHRLDYAYFQTEDGQTRQVTVQAFSPLEQKLLQTAAVPLPFDASVSGTNAVYFDAEMQELRTVRWDYSTEHDSRGYVEARFRSLEPVALSTVHLHAEQKAALCRCLPAVFRTVRNTAGICKLSRSALFPGQKLPDEALLPYIKLIYLLLPAKISEKLIFLNRFADSTLGLACTYPESDGSDGILFTDADIVRLRLLRECESETEYLLLLRDFWENSLHAPFSAEIPAQTPAEQLALALSVWQKADSEPLATLLSMTDSDCITKMLSQMLSDALDALQKADDPAARCAAYQMMMRRIAQLQNHEALKPLHDRLLLKSLLPDCTPEQAFAMLQELGGLLFQEDAEWLTGLCADALSACRSISDLLLAADTISGGSSDAAGVIALLHGRRQQMQSLCAALDADVLRNLQSYAGVCRDPDYEAVSVQMRAAAAADSACGRDFAQYLRESYVPMCRNPLQMLRLSPHYLKGSISLRRLAELAARWTIDDCFSPAPGAVFTAFAACIQESGALPENEANALCAIFEPYAAFLDAVRVRPAESLTESAEQLSPGAREIPALFDKALHICRSADAQALLRFAAISILGAPQILLLLMQEAAGLSTQKPARTVRCWVNRMMLPESADTVCKNLITPDVTGFLRAVYDPQSGLITEEATAGRISLLRHRAQAPAEKNADAARSPAVLRDRAMRRLTLPRADMQLLFADASQTADSLIRMLKGSPLSEYYRIFSEQFQSYQEKEA